MRSESHEHHVTTDERNEARLSIWSGAAASWAARLLGGLRCAGSHRARAIDDFHPAQLLRPFAFGAECLAESGNGGAAKSYQAAVARGVSTPAARSADRL